MGKKPVDTKKYTHELPTPLMDLFKEWCKPGKGYALKVAGAILYYMMLSAEVREVCEKAAHIDDIEKALEQITSLVTKPEPEPEPEPEKDSEDLLGKKLQAQLLDRARYLLQQQLRRQDKHRAKPRAKKA